MRIKSYYVANIKDAMEKARLELGPDAMIVASHRTSGATSRLGTYEVVFGVTDEPAAQLPPIPAPPPPPATRQQEGLERLRDRMEDMRKSVSKKREQASAARTPAPARIAAVLTNAGFPSSLAEELSVNIHARSRHGKHDFLAIAREELNARLRVAPTLGLPREKRSIVALIGPPGAGKTSMLVKLAVSHGIAAGRPVRLIATDTQRVGGAHLLKRYADAMGVRFEGVGSVDALEQSLREDDRNALVFIDTPGFSPASMPKSAELASFLSKRVDVDTHLVLPAYASCSDLSTLAGRFQSFLPSKLMFTGLDMSGNSGAMLAHAIATEAPISFLGVGPEAPEDIEQASTASLTARLIPSLREAAANAA